MERIAQVLILSLLIRVRGGIGIVARLGFVSLIGGRILALKMWEGIGVELNCKDSKIEVARLEVQIWVMVFRVRR